MISWTNLKSVVDKGFSCRNSFPWMLILAVLPYSELLINIQINFLNVLSRYKSGIALTALLVQFSVQAGYVS